MKKGFTLIELLVVVIIIGIIAAIALPRFSDSKAQPYIATLTSDLRTLAQSMELKANGGTEVYVACNNMAVGSLYASLPNFTPSPGVRMTTEIGADDTRWLVWELLASGGGFCQEQLH